MPEDDVSRRDFLTRTSVAASTVVAGAATGQAGAQESNEYVQSDYSVRAKALVSVLTKKNLIDPNAIDAIVDYYENTVGPHIGAGLVALLAVLARHSVQHLAFPEPSLEEAFVGLYLAEGSE